MGVRLDPDEQRALLTEAHTGVTFLVHSGRAWVEPAAAVVGRRRDPARPTGTGSCT